MRNLTRFFGKTFTKSLFSLIMLGLVLAACGAQQPMPTATPSLSQSSGNAANNEPTVKASALKDYIASDPSLVKNTGRPQVVEFFAFWCTVCQGMRPTMHALQDQYGKQVDFVYLDIDAENTKQLQKDLTFTGLRPTIVFLNADGNEVDRTVGEQKMNTLSEKIEALLTAG